MCNFYLKTKITYWKYQSLFLHIATSEQSTVLEFSLDELKLHNKHHPHLFASQTQLVSAFQTEETSLCNTLQWQQLEESSKRF